jgi:hypothetical protein
MHIAGLKDLIQGAFENKKFMTNGQNLPGIDFSQPVFYEVTALKNTGLVGTIKIEDDKIVEADDAYVRIHCLQLSPECIFQSTIVGLLQQCPLTSVCLEGATKIRISITGFTAFGKKPFRRPAIDVISDHTRPVEWRRLQVEHSYVVREKDLEPA